MIDLVIVLNTIYLFISCILYPESSRVGRKKLELRHSMSHAPPLFFVTFVELSDGKLFNPNSENQIHKHCKNDIYY